MNEPREMREVTKQGREAIVKALIHLIEQIEEAFTPRKAVSNVKGVIARGASVEEIGSAFCMLAFQVNGGADYADRLNLEVKFNSEDCEVELTWTAKGTVDFITFTIRSEDGEQALKVNYQDSGEALGFDQEPGKQGELTGAVVGVLVALIQTL
jgi:hypothetical protein